MRITSPIGWISIALAANATFAGPAFAEEVPSPPERPVAPAIVFFPGSGTPAGDATGEWEGPVLTIYDSQSCDAKIAGECALVTFTCDDDRGRGLGIAIDAIETGEVIKWLEAEGEDPKGMQVELKGLPIADPPTIGTIARTDFGSGWTVTFHAPFASGTAGDQLVVKVMPRSVSMEITEANHSALSQFIELCTRE
jgi:hypothetical protein